MQSKTYVNELELGKECEIPLALYEKRLHQYTAKNGQPASALMLTLGDKTGKIAAVMWDNALDYHASLAVDQVHLFQGRVGEFRGQLQLTINRVTPLAVAQIELGDYMPSSVLDREVLWRRLVSVIQSIKEPNLRTLLDNVFDAPTKRNFAMAPAGREVHHAYIGGLLEHTLEVVAYAMAMLEEQGGYLNRDLLLTGCILHDIGKLEEYDLQSLTLQMTDKGKLLGHLQIGAELVAREAMRIQGFPAELRLELEHMLLSHHGLIEWGAVQLPKTANAMALHLADLTSGRLGQFGRIISMHDADSGSWSNWDKFLARSIFVPDYALHN